VEASEIMQARIDLMHVNPGVVQAMLGLEKQVRKAGLDSTLLDLVRMRASQINGCSYCLDMHSKDARANGETEQRLYGLDAWRETPYYSARERAALEWTESLTLVAETRVPDDVYERVREQFSEDELVHLSLAAGSGPADSGFRPTEQVSQAEALGAVSQIDSVQRVTLDQQDAQYIAPLAIRYLVPGAEPAQLLKQDVLGRVGVEKAVGVGRHLNPLPPIHRLLVERRPAHDEEVHFDGARHVEDVDARPFTNRSRDRLLVDVELAAQPIDQPVDV
jgi:AhpD family alkylhydroperoxidase